MQRKLGRTALVLLVLACAGCAGNSVVVDARGTLPSRGTFAFADAEAARLPVETGVAERLRALGLGEREGGDYLIAVGAAERPAGTGALIPTPSEPRQWLRSPDPSRRRSEVRTLTLTISDLRGREVYRASATARRGRAAGGWDGLLEYLLPARGSPPEISAPAAGGS